MKTNKEQKMLKRLKTMLMLNSHKPLIVKSITQQIKNLQ